LSGQGGVWLGGSSCPRASQSATCRSMPTSV
jgi:hypothetical protein